MESCLSSESDFGSYLATVHERDIDLLLMEEFHVSPDFIAWFATRVGVLNAVFEGAWHSVTEADGETDLLLRVASGSSRIGILIENKVTASEQDRQDERYHLRAARAQNAGKFDAFVTCMCAPQGYLDGLPGASLYQARIAYEDIRGWFERSTDTRSRWRCRIMEQAITQGRRGYRMVVNETVSDFHLAFWHYLQRHHPQLTMRRPTAKGNKSNWILFRTATAPQGVGFHIKLDQQCVELGYQGSTVEQVLAAQESWPEDVRLVQKGKTAALSVHTPFLDRMKPLEQQVDPLRTTMEAVTRLLPYVRLLG
jgi:hypothetical protein